MNSREPIIRRVALRIPSLGEDRVQEAFNDAVMDWYTEASPGAAPPSHGWLEMATRRNALDIADAERARKAREIRWAQESDVSITQEPYAEGELSEISQREACWKCDRIVQLLPDDPMRITFNVWSEGGRNTDQFAQALGIRNGTEVERAKEVQRHKDRLRKWCIRHRNNPAIRAALDASF